MSMIISNKDSFEKKKEIFIRDGTSNVHVLTDFDKTLTKGTYEGQPVPSVISLLRTGNYISPEYAAQAEALASHYRPIEFDPKVSSVAKREAMSEWWTKHFELLIKSGLKKSHLEKILQDKRLQFRPGALEFLDRLHDKEIPLIIISSSGIGDTIPMLLDREGRLYKNIHIITNQYEWDKDNHAIKVKEPIVHGANKDESALRKHPAFGAIKDRKNVLLLGDSLGDLKMISGFDPSTLISFGFLEDNIETNRPIYAKEFDAVLEGESNFEDINQLIRSIK